MKSLVIVLLAAFGLPPAGDGLEETLQELRARHENGAEAPKDVEIPEEDANHVMRTQAAEGLPEGVESPWIRFEDSVAIVGATLDFDELKDEIPDSAIFQLLSGRVPAEATARLSAAGGVGKLVLERVTLAGVDLPPDLIASLVDGKDVSAFLPPGFRLGEAFTLPFDLESIRLEPGAALVRQRATK